MILKSIDGIPSPVFPKGVVIADEARKARTRFYPATFILISYCLPLMGIAFYHHPQTTFLYLLLGIALWTLLEYEVHRFVLHGRFPDGQGWLKHKIHKFFDTMHGDHHQRPWDGMYINGYLDALPFGALFVIVSFFLGPYYTAPVTVAGLLQSYVIEEWVHYSVHFHRFQWRYFQYIRFHHWYHHSPRGSVRAFGLTSGLWDDMLGTGIPEPLRSRIRPKTTPLSSEPFETETNGVKAPEGVLVGAREA